MPNSLCQELAERVTAGHFQSIAPQVDSYVSSRSEIYMPYFVSVGGIPMNASGVGRRGYFVRRSGSKVIVKWGAIGMTRTRPTIFYCPRCTLINYPVESGGNTLQQCKPDWTAITNR